MPTDAFSNLPLERLTGRRVDGGTVYSRSDCESLNCLFEAAFVPSAEASVAVQCGVAPACLRVVGVSDAGLAAARRAIRFRWGGARKTVSLSRLGFGG